MFDSGSSNFMDAISIPTAIQKNSGQLRHNVAYEQRETALGTRKIIQKCVKTN